MQELNAVVLYVVIFGPSQFWLASVLLTPVLAGILRETNDENVIFFVSMVGQIVQSVMICSNLLVEFQLNNLASKTSLILDLYATLITLYKVTY